ncbi:hypothetical protein Rsub_07045 [Raphidocelis subcapitata]|uniref:Amine oxidase domain-containing protein n=1 Tax=Raphidocelis subcapitata TaxID=307507 RepID=A0A2V0P3R0_9CHLO|nr:hypothetical protein Rsub_07045 [Raphidocelis subcapitata]|eukprot:GBF94511.1 hypothetical protein Rsub_07045 [Raphidocelis subcapitata]
MQLPRFTLAAAMAALMLVAQPEPAAAGSGAALVVGAGVSGLKAALDLATKGFTVTVLEARDGVGGRIQTESTPFGPLELGAQWIHGTDNPIWTLAGSRSWKLLPSNSESGAELEATATGAKAVTDAEAAAWDTQFAKLETYIANLQANAENSETLQSGVDKFVSTRGIAGRKKIGLDARIESNWVQEYAASPSKLSLNWFDNEPEITGEDSILAAGYTATLIHYLESALKAKGGKIVLNAPVTNIAYGTSAGVTITAGGAKYTGKFAVITLPVGVLQSGSVTFQPALPSAKAAAIKYLGMGVLNKVILGFPDSAKWATGNWIERIPLLTDAGRWREFFSLRGITGKPVIVAFTAGEAAKYPAGTTDDELVSGAVSALRGMFGAANIPDPTYSYVTRWHEDPYSLGSYSVVAPGAKGTERTALAATLNRLLYFAGEATSKTWPSTVPGAWQSGIDAATKAARDWA